jgi:ABC-2 type transport system ATP-binding protein
MIKIKKINKVFDSDLLKKPFKALDDMEFVIPENKIIGFLGANGAGKTTLIKIMMDFIRPTSGSIEFDRVLGRNKKEIFKNLGYLPERPYFYPTLTGNEFIQYLGEVSNVKKMDLIERKKHWAPRFKIEFALDRQIKTYSKGMLQRLGFLATLIHDPKMIILDEPLSGLDPVGRKELKEIIVQVRNEGKTVFFSSHIVSDVEEVCENVIFIKDGKLAYEGRVEDLVSEHTKKGLVLKYWKEEQLFEEETDENALVQKITSLQTSNCKIHSISHKRVTLEEIIYKV